MRTPRPSLATFVTPAVMLATAWILPSHVATPDIVWEIRSILLSVFLPCACWIIRVDLMDSVKAKLRKHELIKGLYYGRDQKLEEEIHKLRMTLRQPDAGPFGAHDDYVVALANKIIRKNIRTQATTQDLRAAIREAEDLLNNRKKV